MVVAMAAVVVSCGTATGPGTGTRHTLTAVHHHGPRAKADAYARRLLARLRLPGHAHRLPWPARPLRSLRPMLPVDLHDVTDLHALYHLTLAPAAVNAYLVAHTPAGMRAGDVGQSGQAGTITGYDVDYHPAVRPAWLYDATLASAIVSAPGGGSLVRVDAQVAWYPPRSAAEHIVATRYRAVTTTAPTHWSGPPRPVTRTFTAPAVVARLAALVNGWPAMPDTVINCPAITAASTLYRLVFVPASPRWPTISITSTGCLSVVVRVGGRGQPALDDGGELVTTIDRLLGLPGRS
jgi:hypothetical protein